jgi:hypothetical protein
MNLLANAKVAILLDERKATHPTTVGDSSEVYTTK